MQHRAMADQPIRLSDIVPVTECSASGEYCVTSNPKDNKTTYPEGNTFIYRKDQPEKPLWQMPGWFRVVFLADDGEHLVTGDNWELAPLEQPERYIAGTFMLMLAIAVLASMGRARLTKR